MLAYSHQITSVAVVEGYCLVNHVAAMEGFLSGIVILAATDVGALLPDIDQNNSKINQKLPLNLGKYFEHRGITHSLLGWFIFSVIAFLLLDSIQYFSIDNPWTQDFAGCIFCGLSAGYFLHLLEDSFSQAGIRWWQPWSDFDHYAFKKYRVVLRPVHHYIEDENGHQIPCRHFWGRGYAVGSDGEKKFAKVMTGLVVVMTVVWLFELIF